MKALVGLLAACVVFFTFARSAPAQVVFSFGGGYCAPSYYPWYGGYYDYPGYAYYSYYPSYFGFGWGGYYRPWWRHSEIATHLTACVKQIRNHHEQSSGKRRET